MEVSASRNVSRLTAKVMSKYVKIEWTELRRLLKKEEKLDALEALGVDNWEGYDMQWDEEELGFERLGSDNEAWDKYISENYDEV